MITLTRINLKKLRTSNNLQSISLNFIGIAKVFLFTMQLIFLKVFIRRQKLLRNEKTMWPKVAGIYLSLGLMFLFSISFFSNLARSTGLIFLSFCRIL